MPRPSPKERAALRPGSKDPNEELRNALKRARELDAIPMPNAPGELGPPGSSVGKHGSAGMGGYDIARAKRKKKKGNGSTYA